MDVIPSFYRTTTGSSDDAYFDGAFSNYLLRPGEVKRVVYPEDSQSLSKKFIEFDVLVQHRENGTAHTKMYHAVLLANPLGGLADRLVYTPRVDARAGLPDAQRNPGVGLGSKVLLLCANGDHSGAFIVGGVRDERDSDAGRKGRGHHLDFEFNGVNFTVADDGSWKLENKGKTAADGTADSDRDAGAGTTLEVKASGNWEVHTPNDKQRVVVDHAAGTVEITGENITTIDATRINLGAGTEPGVLGLQLVQILQQLLTLIIAQTHIAPGGTTTPPVNAPAFAALALKLEQILSHQTFLAR